MLAYLSPEWMRQADELLRRAPGLAVIGDPLTIEQTVTTQREPIRYHVRFDQAGARLQAGPADGATVTLALDYATAAAVGRGQLSAQAAFQSGDIRVGGNMQRLIAHREVISASDDVLGPLRAATEWADA